VLYFPVRGSGDHGFPTPLLNVVTDSFAVVALVTRQLRKRRFLGFDSEPICVNAAGKRFEDVCGATVVALKRGEPQPFLPTPTPIKLDKVRIFRRGVIL
jgi:hypothetical protein